MDQNDYSRGSDNPSGATNDFGSTSNESAAGNYGSTGGAAGGSSMGSSGASASSNFGSDETSRPTERIEGFNAPREGFTDRVREIAGSAQHTLADVSSTVGEKASAAKSAIADTVESGMDRIKNIDFDSLKASVEREVRDHPGRTLLMAVGVGYLVGRAFKK